MIGAIFTPKLITVFQEGYRLSHFKADAVAGLTVAIVALPLSMAIAIASHAPPAAGLVSAIVGGFLISLLGGSRFQIGGPAGAFIVLVASIIDEFGFDGLLVASFMAGVFMLVGGFLRLGAFVRLVPHPVIVGFSAGIAVIIFASQLKELFGIVMPGTEPSALIAKLKALWMAADTLHLHAILIACAALAIIVVLRLTKPHWPGFLFAVTFCSFAASMFSLDAATIGSRFNGIPQTLAYSGLPAFTSQRLLALLPSALSLALLGAVESLLSATVADNMKGRQHRSHAELVAQGLANMAAPLFGGITVTGTIARTATNVRAGAHGPVSGILHAVFLLCFMLVAAPLAVHIPLAALAGVLVVVSWNMFERDQVWRLLQHWPTAVVFLITLLLTVFEDLIVGISAGTLLFYVLSWLLPRTSA
jgi:sulfate permease, SulP family